MKTVLIVLGVIALILVIAMIVLYFVGKKMQKKQDESQAQMEAASQVATILVIDKKKMKLKDAGLPKIVLDSTPKYLRGSKVPIVKAKVGPKVMSLICDDKIFPQLPIKKELRVVISGIYIMGVKGRNVLDAPPEKMSMWQKGNDEPLFQVNPSFLFYTIYPENLESSDPGSHVGKDPTSRHLKGNVQPDTVYVAAGSPPQQPPLRLTGSHFVLLDIPEYR